MLKFFRTLFSYKKANKSFWVLLSTLILFLPLLILSDSFNFDIVGIIIGVNILIGVLSFLYIIFYFFFKYPKFGYLTLALSLLSISGILFISNNQKELEIENAKIEEEKAQLELQNQQYIKGWESFSQTQNVSDLSNEIKPEKPNPNIESSKINTTIQQQPIDKKQEYIYYSGNNELREIEENLKNSNFEIESLPKIPEYKDPPIPKKIESPEFSPRVCITQNGVLVCNQD